MISRSQYARNIFTVGWILVGIINASKKIDGNSFRADCLYPIQFAAVAGKFGAFLTSVDLSKSHS